MPGQTLPRNTSRAAGDGGVRLQNSVASGRPPGAQTRTSRLGALDPGAFAWTGEVVCAVATPACRAGH